MPWWVEVRRSGVKSTEGSEEGSSYGPHRQHFCSSAGSELDGQDRQIGDRRRHLTPPRYGEWWSSMLACIAVSAEPVADGQLKRTAACACNTGTETRNEECRAGTPTGDRSSIT